MTLFARREFLRLGAFAVGLLLAESPALAAVGKLALPERRISLYNTHTGERLDAVYWAGGRYEPEALAEVDRILRDHRTGEIKPIDPGLLDSLFSLRTKLGSSRPFHIISGYRSPETNSFLRAHTRGVAEGSLHIEGKAADVRLPGRGLRALWKAALDLGAGGVGYYGKTGFVHLDTGPVRRWEA